MALKFVQAERDEPDPAQVAMQNLLSHLPGEATALYLAGLDMVVGKTPTAGKPDAAPLIVVALVSLAVLLLVRYLAKASLAVTVSSLIAFVIWVYAIGNGPFQALGLGLAQGLAAFAIVAYSTIITVLATKGIIK